MIAKESTNVSDHCSGEVSSVCNLDQSSEQALIAAAQAGIRGAMDELLLRHRGTMLGVARRFVKTSDDAEDLVQDAMLRAVKNIGSFRKESRFGTWLVAIVKNSALSMKRKERTACWVSIDGVQQADSGPSLREIPDSRLSPEEESIRKELLHLLGAAIANQPKKHQLVLSMCVLDKRPIGAVAATVGLTSGSVKSHLFRARRSLSETFARQGYTKVRRPKAPMPRRSFDHE